MMLVVEGQRLPFGLLVESAHKSEVELAEEALATVNVARPAGLAQDEAQGACG
jgi:hypothetical protein